MSAVSLHVVCILRGLFCKQLFLLCNLQADRISSSSATASVKSAVRNLSSVCTEVSCEEACEAIAYYFNNKSVGKVCIKCHYLGNLCKGNCYAGGNY